MLSPSFNVRKVFQDETPEKIVMVKNKNIVSSLCVSPFLELQVYSEFVVQLFSALNKGKAESLIDMGIKFYVPQYV